MVGRLGQLVTFNQSCLPLSSGPVLLQARGFTRRAMLIWIFLQPSGMLQWLRSSVSQSFFSHLAYVTNALAGEICTEWQTWSQVVHLRSLLGQSILQSFIYITLAVSSASRSSKYNTVLR
jgi:hypothetical protein